MEVIDHIKYIIEKIRPYMISDGGDVKFVKYEDGIVYITISGACADCALADTEITDTVETILTSEIPEVVAVEVIKENTNES